MKRSVTVVSMALVCVLGFVGFNKLSQVVDKPKGFDPATIPDVVEYTAGIPKDTAVATVDGAPITAETYLYWASYATEMIQYQQFGGGEIDWSMDVKGVTLADYLKSGALQSAELYQVVENQAEKLGCGLNADNLKAMDAAQAAMLEKLGDETQLEKWLLNVNMTPEGYRNVSKTGYLYDNLLKTQTDSSPAGKAEMAEYVAANDLLRAKHILIMTVDSATGEALNEEKQAAAKAKADDLLTQLRDGGNSLSLFDQLMNANSEDSGLAQNPDGYTFTADQMVPEFEAGTRALEYGEISDVVESEFGYHIILRLDPGNDALAVQIGQARAEQQMDALMSQWMEEAQMETTEAYDQLDLPSFFSNLLSLRGEIAAADAAAEAAEATPTPAA